MPPSLALPVLRPTALVAPERFSYSTLQQLRQCPRRWQLQHARYGEQLGYPERFHPAAERGRMIHRLLSLLFRAMAAAGNPAPGTLAFRAAARDLDALSQASLLVDEAWRKLGAHPRGRGQHIKTTPVEIYAAASLLFQREYRPLSSPPSAVSKPSPARAQESFKKGSSESEERLTHVLARRGSVSEKSLTHPALPLHGIVDLLLQGSHGAVVVDFKTGAPHPSHREQISLYGLLWWRQEGALPERGEVRYGARVEPVALPEDDLQSLEERLSAEIARFTRELREEASATPGDHCNHCPVRAFCDVYWRQEPIPPPGWVDAELLIAGEDALGLRGSLPSGQSVRLLLSPELEPLRAELAVGARTRWLGLRWHEPTGGLQATPETEVFLLPEAF